jgi:hypothetical protein
MSVSLTLRGDKGTRLTNTEVDTNFTNISTELDLKAPINNPVFTGSGQFTGALTVDGDLEVSGTTTFINVQNLGVADTMIYVNQRTEGTLTNAVGDGTNVVYTVDNNYVVGDFLVVQGVTPSSFNIDGAEIIASDATSVTVASTNTDTYVSGGSTYAKTYVNLDLGLAGGYNSDGTAAGYAHTGLFRDATDGFWKFYEGYTPEPSAGIDIDTGHASFQLASISANVVNAVDFNSTSDISLKKNISVIENALYLIKNIEGVTFEWKDSGKPSIGVVAQQVETVVPEIVNTGSDGIKRVSYDSLIPILIEAVKELSDKIDKL